MGRLKRSGRWSNSDRRGRRRTVAQGAVRPLGVVVDTPLLDQDLRFQSGERRFAVTVHEPTSRNSTGAAVNNYDHFILSADCLEEFITARRIDTTIVHDHSDELRNNGTRKLTSDHFPIVAFFKTSGAGVALDQP